MIDSRDLPKLAELLIETGQRLAAHGEQAWQASQDYAPGPRAAHSDADGHGGNRWDEDDDGQVWPVPADPTGEQAARSDATSMLHAGLRVRLGLVERYVDEVRHLLLDLVPNQPNVRLTNCGECGGPKPTLKSPSQVKTAVDVVAEGWCRSCYRLDKRLEPIETDSQLRRYYREHCRWCGGFRAEHGCEPPLELLRRRHIFGRRISLTDIEASCPHCQARAKAS